MNGGQVIHCPRCGEPNQRTTRQCVRCGLQRGTRPGPAGPPPGYRQGPPTQGPQPYRQPGPPQGPPQYGQPGPPPGWRGGRPPAGDRVPSPGQRPAVPADQAGAEWSPTGAGPDRDAPARRFDTAAARAKTGLWVRGGPPPASAPERVRSHDEVPAPMRRRVASTGLDTLLCAGLVIVPFWRVYRLDGSWWPPVILLLGLAAVVLVTVLRARSGRSLFSGLFGIRTVVGEPGHPPGLRPMLRRHLVSVGAFLAAGAGIWSAFRDPTGRRRTWQDNAAGTRVIDTRWGADPLAKAGEPEQEEEEAGGATGGVVSDRSGAGVVVVPSSRGSRRTRPGVLRGGLDMTPSVANTTGAATALEQSVPVAVVDAAERAAGGNTGQPEPVVVESTPQRIAVRLVDDTGRSVALVRSALIGRDPAAGPEEDVEHLMALDDPGRTVSKTHLRVDVAPHGVTVLDRGSSNGTTARIAGVDHILAAGVPLGVPVGTVLLLGERTVVVEAP